MPEVEAYDKELQTLGIIPVRDEKGRFLKGQKVVRKPKNVYSDLMPKLNCDTCYASGKCPEYQAGYVCAYNKLFKRFNTRNREDVMDAIHSLVELNLSRLQRQAIFEVLDGGMADATVTQLLDQNIKLLNLLQQIGQQQRAVIAQKKTVVTEDGKMETIETIQANPDQGGILAKMFSFGGQSRQYKDEEEPIDITPQNSTELDK